MNYQRIYDQIIDRAKQEKRQKGQGIYYERHHIVPKCLGGSNRKNNLILLTAKEHYIAHRLLVEIQTPGSRGYYQMLNAFSFFAAKSKNHSRVVVSAKFYQEVKAFLAEKRRGIPRSEETRAKIRETKAKNPRTISDEERLNSSRRMVGENNPMYGKTHTEEVKKYLRELKLGKKNPAVSEANKKRMGVVTRATRAIRQIDEQGNEIKTYTSIAEAKRQTGIKSIIGALRGRWVYAGGYRWEYL